MANLTEVALAIKNNDRRAAARMLTEIIKETPSAEAYYLAALLSKDKDKARAHLKRALSYDSRHKKANQLWIELGGKPLQVNKGELPIVARVIGFFQDFGTNIPGLGPILNRLHPNVRGGLVAALFIMLIAINLILLMQFLGAPASAADDDVVVEVQPTVDVTPTPIPAPSYEEVIISAGALEAYLAEHGYGMRPIANYISENAPQQFLLTGELPYDVYVLVYDTLAAATSDQYRDMYGVSYVADGFGNVRLYFPTNVDDATVDALVELVSDLTLAVPAPIMDENNAA
ncbi:hypothetical protein KC957_00630 [Candidatus Saccharibacteria bacterium]|nr:hypothetical protein [Candidatus Saccharibacteria bacterium]